MKLSWILGLAALMIALASSAQAQGLSQALPTEYEAFTILPTQNVSPGSGNAVTSGAIADPAEIVSIDYDSTAASGVGPLTITVTYSDKEDGPFVALEDDASQGGMSTVTMNTTPTSGADFKGANAKFAKFKLTNGAGLLPLKRLTGLRRKLGRNARPQALADRVVDLGLSGTVTNTNRTAFSNAFAAPGDFLSFLWDSSGSVGTRDLEFYYSNSPDGPFVAWEDQSVASPAYQNKATSTALDIAITAKPFQALNAKFKWRNASGASSTLTRASGTRREQQKR